MQASKRGVQQQRPMAVQPVPPLFTVTFDVKRGGKIYDDFIADLCRRLGNPGHFSHNRPVLPPFDHTVPPRWWIHVMLKSSPASEVTLAVRADNLYLEGFQSSDGKWWELTTGFIPGATYLGFGGNYSDLFKGTSFKDLDGVLLGPKHMADAVDAVATCRDTRGAHGAAAGHKEALLVLLLMVVEATRLVTVSEFVGWLMHPKSAMKSDKIPAHMAAQVHGWQDPSKVLLRTDAKFVDPQGGMHDDGEDGEDKGEDGGGGGHHGGNPAVHSGSSEGGWRDDNRHRDAAVPWEVARRCSPVVGVVAALYPNKTVLEYMLAVACGDITLFE